MCFSIRPLKLNITRARRCGFTLDHFRENFQRSLDGAAHFAFCRERHARLNLTGRRIEDIAEAAGRAFDELAGDEMVEFFHDEKPCVLNRILSLRADDQPSRR